MGAFRWRQWFQSSYHSKPHVQTATIKEIGWTELEVINKCDQQSEYLVERTISGSINFPDGVKEAEMKFVWKQISKVLRLSNHPNILIIWSSIRPYVFQPFTFLQHHLCENKTWWNKNISK